MRFRFQCSRFQWHLREHFRRLGHCRGLRRSPCPLAQSLRSQQDRVLRVCCACDSRATRVTVAQWLLEYHSKRKFIELPMASGGAWEQWLLWTHGRGRAFGTSSLWKEVVVRRTRASQGQWWRVGAARMERGMLWMVSRY